MIPREQEFEVKRELAFAQLTYYAFVELFLFLRSYLLFEMSEKYCLCLNQKSLC